ncbi:DUF4354 family protein [Providencia rettgeri]|uniref:DUF4354 family protein n=1 Tax=Providencia rettgeri TaxID=587 RepID=UPI0023610232|nr:DUF4354 family protein [Providencia rettgeri]
MFKKLSLLLLAIIPTQVFAIPDMTKNELNIYTHKGVNSTSTIQGDPFYVTTFKVGVYAPEKYKNKGIEWLRDGCFVAITDEGEKFHGGKMDGNMNMHILQKYSYSSGEIEFKSKNKKLYEAIFIDWTPDKCPE